VSSPVIAFIFGVEIDKDIVRRVLARHYRPEPGSGGPSWLTFLGHSKDSLWSVDMFRCEQRYLSSDNDPLFRYHQWKANLRILDIKEVKTVPYIPLSHPFVERLVGSVRREFTDQTPFWHARDLERKLRAYADYYNGFRVHHALDGVTPQTNAGDGDRKVANLNNYQWQSHCRGLYQLPVAA
jgi:hypothetical protein